MPVRHPLPRHLAVALRLRVLAQAFCNFSPAVRAPQRPRGRAAHGDPTTGDDFKSSTTAGRWKPAMLKLVEWMGRTDEWQVPQSSSPAGLAALLVWGAVGTVIHYMGYTPGLLIVGLFGIMIIWMYGYFWITGMLLVAGGRMCSLKHARFVIPVLAMYDVYCVAVRVGWLGVFFTLNLSFLTNDLLNKLLQGYEGSTEERPFEEMKHSDPATVAFFGSPEYPPAPDNELETASSAKPFRSEPTQDVLHVQKEPSPSKIVESYTTSLDEIKRIMDALTYYKVMGIPRSKSIDLNKLKAQYRKMILLVHPDKNMGNSLACESFKKLQSPYEVLLDTTKKNSYDEQLRKEESRQMNERSRVVSQPGRPNHPERTQCCYLEQLACTLFAEKMELDMVTEDLSSIITIKVGDQGPHREKVVGRTPRR